MINKEQKQILRNKGMPDTTISSGEDDLFQKFWSIMLIVLHLGLIIFGIIIGFILGKWVF